MKGIFEELKEQPFFKDFTDDHLRIIAGCGRNVIFKAGNQVAIEGDPADSFYLIRHGQFRIENSIPGQRPLVCQTVSNNEICGWSWLFKPYLWSFDVVASTETRVIALDGKCLRQKCQNNFELGYYLMSKFSEVMANRLKNTRLQLMDVYGNKK